MPKFGSVTPLGRVTLAVLAKVPVADELSFPIALYVTILPDGIVTVSSIVPVPLAVNPEAPPLWVAVKVTPVNTAGKMSCTDASETLLGPLLLIAIE